MTATHSEAATLHDGLAAELVKRRRKKLPALTVALALAAAIAAGAILGVEAQKHWGSSTSATSTRGFPSGFPGAGGGSASGSGFPSGAGFGAAGAGFGAAGFAAGGTSGTVTLIKGSTLYVTDTSGNTVLVHTSATSRVSKTVAGTVKSVHPGDSVTVVGTKNKNGSYSARQVTIGASSNG
jgi:hypothetical protein